MLSITIPLFNEAENIPALYERLVRELEALARPFEIILVNDGSSDDSERILDALAGQDPRVKVVHFRRNFGQTAAMMAGIHYASGEIIVPMDGDLQNDPADMGLLLSHIEEGYDVVSGWRRDRKDRMVSRRLPSMAANWLIGRLTGTRIHDNGCTLKAYRSDVVKRTKLYAEMHRFLAPMMSLTGCRTKEVVVNHRSRQFGRSKYGISRIWKVFLDLLTIKMLLGFTTRPASWFALLSLPFMAGSCVGLAASVWSYANLSPAKSYPIVFPSVTILFAAAAVHLLLIGMFAELVVKVGDFKEKDAVLASVDSGGISA
jgi:glycosyltransferase involved in cell wall biosynthesis